MSSWVEARDVAKHPTVCRTAPLQRILLPKMSVVPRSRNCDRETDSRYYCTTVYFSLPNCAGYFQSSSAICKRCRVCGPGLRMVWRGSRPALESFVFPVSGLPRGEQLVRLYIGPGRLKSLILSAPSVKWFKLQILPSSKILAYIKGIMLVCSDFRRLKFLTHKSIGEIINGEMIMFQIWMSSQSLVHIPPQCRLISWQPAEMLNHL